MSNYDPGVSTLDIIAHSDEGKQLRRLEREFSFHRDRAIEANGGKVKGTGQRSAARRVLSARYWSGGTPRRSLTSFPFV